MKKVCDYYYVGVEGDVNFFNYSNFCGVVCNGCNINFWEFKFILVIFYNFRGFDGYIFC